MMFSISTIASSTRMPTTSESDNRVTTFRVKPNRYMNPKAGRIDSGSAVAAMKVARQSRRKSQTTSTARKAPSIKRDILPSKFSRTGSTKLKASVISMSGCSRRSRSSRSRTPAATSVSPAPRLRTISKPTTGLPFKSAALRCSATVSLTRATWSSRMRRPSDSTMSIAASSAAVCTVPMVRTDCSTPPMSARPPEASCWIWRSWREMSAAVALSASSRSGSSWTSTWRSTPPTRATAPTPRTASRPLVTVLSTNQERASSSIRGEAMV